MDLPSVMSRAPSPDLNVEPDINETKRASSERFGLFRNLVLLLSLIPFSGCDSEPENSASQLERIKQSGELRVATRHSPSAYFEGANGTVGLEHDLARRFAERLQVKVKFLPAASEARIKRMVAEGDADIAAGVFREDPGRDNPLRFGPTYRRVAPQVLYNGDAPPPRSVADLSHGVLSIEAGSPYAAVLKHYRLRHPNLRWRVHFGSSAHDLPALVNDGLADYTVADSDLALLMRRRYPDLRVAFDLGPARELAWATPPGEDASLHTEVARFFAEVGNDHTLDQLFDRYYGHAEAFDPALDRSLRKHYHQRLPRFRRLFMQAGRQHGLDWRLLAAVSYQESQWQSAAVSAEGVRGLMMLTGNTAKELKVTDRSDAAQSIAGGASYFSRTLAGIPPQIQDPDRVWYALAAYNLGPGHVQDARDLVRAQGGDPDKWIEIKRVLPLLSKPAWYQRTKHGQARGGVAVHYVNSIRRYYDLLVWLTQDEANRKVALGEAARKDRS